MSIVQLEGYTIIKSPAIKNIKKREAYLNMMWVLSVALETGMGKQEFDALNNLIGGIHWSAETHKTMLEAAAKIKAEIDKPYEV